MAPPVGFEINLVCTHHELQITPLLITLKINRIFPMDVYNRCASIDAVLHTYICQDFEMTKIDISFRKMIF